MKTKEKEYPNLLSPLEGLAELSGNLWWSWHPAARMLFKRLDRQVWKESGHNPDLMLKELSAESLRQAAQDPDYIKEYDRVLNWFREDTGQGACACLGGIQNLNGHAIAYFSAEYGLHHCLPFYAGGLGFLAGDILKECSDLRVPLVAVGFMYPEGYFRQKIREDGWQEQSAEILDRDATSISRVVNKDGEQLIVKVPLTDPPIHVAVWKIKVGSVCLYLMDTDIEINDPWNRRISAHLYTGDLEYRLRQEIVLGIGGAEVLQMLGITCSILHLNEGHPAFALLEKTRDFVQRGMSFNDAADLVRATTVFTTHTPVPAGHDVFPFSLMEKYFRSYWPSLGLGHDDFLRLGMHPQAPEAGFNMTAFALRMSGHRNAVSKKHAEVTRSMWQSLWPELPQDQVPIDYVTNGVHIPTWVEPKMELLFDQYLGADWLEKHDDPSAWDAIDSIPDDELWRTHYWLKIKLIDAIRERARQRWTIDRTSSSTALAGGALLDPSILTIGFARRFASYKRGDLIFRDLDRLKKLLNDRWRPVQFIFAGKAHPADDLGKRILQKVFNSTRDPLFGGRIAFVENYGEQFAQYLVHGVDVWLNNPIPPLEASGTSGMKAALNGVPHLSIYDGWWAEGFNGKNGWLFGQGNKEGERDQADADEIYRILEEEVVPAYYSSSENGVHHEWVKIMKETIKQVGPHFSARRMVKEYAHKFWAKALNVEKSCQCKI